jgi:hypothetical protein
MRWATLALGVLVAFPSLAADEFSVDEDALFSDTTTVVADSGLIDTSGGKTDLSERTSIGFSGEVTSLATADVERTWFTAGQHREDVNLGAGVVGNFMLDVRLPRGTKAFGNAEVNLSGMDSTGEMGADFYARELFVDANIARRVYVRAGKQVLQWGRCFFWNPTDLINVERKPFIEKIGGRKGVLGVRVHTVFGTRANFYGFLDLHDLQHVDSLAGALKAEVLLGGVEMALSVWSKRGYTPVVGFDMSSGLMGALFTLEVSLTEGPNYPTVGVQDGYLVIDERKGQWYPRVAFGTMAILDLFGVDDRLNVGIECYYNGAAHDKSILEDRNEYPLPPGTGPENQLYTKSDFFFANELYEENSNARWYAAMFSSISDVIVSDLTLDLNAIMNVNDWSSVVTGALTYRTLHDLTVGLSVSGFLGKSRSEYAMPGKGMLGRLTMGVVF